MHYIIFRYKSFAYCSHGNLRSADISWDAGLSYGSLHFSALFLGHKPVPHYINKVMKISSSVDITVLLEYFLVVILVCTNDLTLLSCEDLDEVD